MFKTLFSADSHVVEPKDFWHTHVDKKFRDSAPRVVEKEGGGLVLVAPGIEPSMVASSFAAGRGGVELKEWVRTGNYETGRPSAWDPVERLKDQDIDGVTGEVLYTSQGRYVFNLPDRDAQLACFRAYNEWLGEFSATAPDRLIGVALIPTEDIKVAVAELERAAKLGLKGALIGCSAPEDRPYSSEEYDLFWRTASEMSIPVSLHCGTGKGRESDQKGTAERFGLGKPASAPRSSIAEFWTQIIHEVQRTLSDMIFHGVFERFPDLKVVSVENDIGWMANYAHRIDHACEKFGALLPKPLPLKPSEYLKRNVFATFQDDPAGIHLYNLYGAENFMWANDFPHADSTWPNSRSLLKRDLTGIPDEVCGKIVYGNVAQLYSFA